MPDTASTRLELLWPPRAEWGPLQVAGAALLVLSALVPLALLLLAPLKTWESLRLAAGTCFYCVGMALLLLNLHASQRRRRLVPSRSSLGSSLCGECPTCGAEAAWSPGLAACPVCGY